jgi:hypothetical protein
MPRLQDNFRVKLVELLLVLGQDAEVPRKRVYLYIDSEALEILFVLVLVCQDTYA